jgi:hypothetical protein
LQATLKAPPTLYYKVTVVNSLIRSIAKAEINRNTDKTGDRVKCGLGMPREAFGEKNSVPALFVMQRTFRVRVRRARRVSGHRFTMGAIHPALLFALGEGRVKVSFILMFELHPFMIRTLT